MLGLHENFLDFEILETGNTKTLVFLDSSTYMENPEKPLLEVIMPGYTKYFLVNINANKINTFNSSNLGINQVLFQTDLVDLPDGIWKFKYKICPYKYVYKVLTKIRITTLLKKLEVLYNQVDLRDCAGKEDRDLETAFVKIDLLIQGSKAAVEKNPKLAQEYYQLADKLIQKQLDKFCKNCK